MSLPRILIIDDIFGSSIRDRKNLCKIFGLLDLTGDDPNSVAIANPVAEAVFESGQQRTDNSVVNSPIKALEAVEKGWGESKTDIWALILLDLRFESGTIDEDGEPEGNTSDELFGLTLLDIIHSKYPDQPVIILSSKVREEVIENCRRRGAADFIQRHGDDAGTLSPRDLLYTKILEHGLIEDTRILSDEKLRIVGASVSLCKTLRAARRAATGKGNILLLGETGTGKELLARYIHDMSPKAKGPYQVFNPGRVAETLQEDELFGHVKGAFTGANSDQQGVFELANGGTLFIDEIGEVQENLQNKLLRPLESWSVRRQGGKIDIPINLQVILATNKNLDLYVQEKKFKSDLLNRIKSYPIIIPPLRERKEDIPRITYQLLQILCSELNARWPRTILDESMELLVGHAWKDNVRDLRNVLQRVVYNHKDSELVVPQDIQFDSIDFEEPPEQKYTNTRPPVDPLQALLENIINFEFPQEYGMIHGKLPEMQQAIAILMAKYFQAAIEVTKKRKPGSSAVQELNLTGAVSCMVGTQLKTPKAADFVKKLLQQDESLLSNIEETYPELHQAYNEAIRLRPKKPKKNG